MLLRDNLAGQGINVNAAASQNVNAVVSIQYSSIRSSLEAVFLAWNERLAKPLCWNLRHLLELYGVEGGIEVQRR